MNKYLLQKAAKVFSPALYYSQVHQLSKPWYAGMGHILMFHRVVPETDKLRIHNHESLEVTPEYLEDLIQFFKKKNYRFISLDELQTINQEKQSGKFVAFTFDDGYIDNLKYAYPIFKKHNVPFTIYVATNLPDGTATLWWYLLEDLIVENSRVGFTMEDQKLEYSAGSVREKEMAFNSIRSLLSKADESLLKILMKSLFSNKVELIREKTRELSLSWDQIRELSNDPLVAIGSHTVNHFPLDSLSFDKSEFEILESKKILERQLSKDVKHFCYPLGSYGDKEIEILGKSGYSSATTIKMANIFPENLSHPFSLPRIMINSLTTEKILTLQINGLLPALRNKLKRVVT